ncbi:MAG: hypothetical protein HPY84_03280 [Syntrophobacteraceae bacterium]|nr:hypothetical protein [Syntrophobacteraceae bacterium]
MKVDNLLFLAVLLAVTCGGVAESGSADYPADFQFVEVPDPMSADNPIHHLVHRPVPKPGEKYRDLCFGTVVSRVTRKLGMRHEYSRFDPFNLDQSMVVLTWKDSFRYRVYRTKYSPYNAAGGMLFDLKDLQEPRWDPERRHVLRGFRGLKIVSVNVKTGREKVLKDFKRDPVIGPLLAAEPDIDRVGTNREGESSLDLRYWALCLHGTSEEGRMRYIFTWDKAEDRVLGTRRLSVEEAALIDWVGMSPSGEWVLICGRRTPWNLKLHGLNMADRNLQSFHRLTHRNGHSDVAFDIHGNEVIVMNNTHTNFVDMIPLSKESRPVTKMDDYENNAVRPLVKLVGSTRFIHVSCNYPGYCVLSSYGMKDQPKEKNWLDRSIVLVKLDPSRPVARYLAKVYNLRGASREETRAAMSGDGRKVIWAENWGRNVGEEKTFVMQLDMPANWEQFLDLPRGESAAPNMVSH